jgi:hypothetical protein
MDLIIGIDYGVASGDMSVYTVAKRKSGKMTLVDSGNIEEIDYSKYVASEHQVVGEKKDLELFKKQFLTQE